MTQPLRELATAVGTTLDTRVVGTVHVGGGSIAQTYRMSLEDGRQVFVKSHPGGLPAMFEREAQGLAWLGDTATVRVPRVLAVNDEDSGQPPTDSDSPTDSGADAPRFLVLDWIEPGHRDHTWQAELGRSLARLHRYGAPRFGLDVDNFIAELHQPNSPCSDWAEFYATQRLEPFARDAFDRGRLSRALVDDFERLYPRLDQLVGPPEPPARLHGDLWSANALADANGEPWLIDPAVYGGHREVDLAMMELFGGFDHTCFDAYDEVYPRAEGHRERVALYQLYPLLVHVILFGGGYASRLQHALRALL